MKTTLFTLIFTVSVLSANILYSQNFPKRPQPLKQLNDLTNDWLSSGQAIDINKDLVEFRNQHNIDFVIVLIDSLPGMERRYYTNELGNQWNVGQNYSDSALVLMVSRLDRTSFLAVGKPLQLVISDGQASKLLKENLVPAFKAEDYKLGLTQTIAAVDSIIIDFQENEKYQLQRHLGVLWYVVLLVVFLLLRKYAVQGSYFKYYEYHINSYYTSSALTSINVVLNYFLFKWNLWVSLALGVVFGIWFRNVAGALWFYSRDLLTIKSKDFKDLKVLPVSILAVLFNERNFTINDILKQLFYDLLSKGIIEIIEDNREPVKGVEIKTLEVKKGPRYGNDAITPENELILEKLGNIPKQLKNFLSSPFSTYGNDGYLRYYVGKEMVAYGLITKSSWFWGKWAFTKKGNDAIQKLKTAVNQIEVSLKDKKSEIELVESLSEYGNLIGLVPGFLDEKLKNVFKEVKTNKANSHKMTAEEVEEDQWFWFVYYYAQLDYVFELNDLYDSAISPPEYSRRGGSKSSSGSSSNYSTDYSSSSDSSYSSGSFDGGGGGADW